MLHAATIYDKEHELQKYQAEHRIRRDDKRSRQILPIYGLGLGLTLDDTPLGTYRRGGSSNRAGSVALLDGGATIDQSVLRSPSQPKQESLWARLGRGSQRRAPAMAVLLLAAAVPFAAALTRFSYVEDLTPLMQTTHPTTKAFLKIRDVYLPDLPPLQLLIVAPSQSAMASREWSLATCHMLQDLATKVTDRMHEEGHDCTMYDISRTCL